MPGKETRPLLLFLSVLGFLPVSKHLDDKDEEFLHSKLFEKMHEKVVEKTAARWYRENETVKQFVENFQNYEMDLSRGILLVETK